jgi:hypothetical protein
VVANPPSEEEALKFEAALFEDLRRTVRHFRDGPVKIERLSLVGWPPDTQVAVVFDTGLRSIEERHSVWKVDARGERWNAVDLSMSIWGEIEALTFGLPDELDQ